MESAFVNKIVICCIAMLSLWISDIIELTQTEKSMVPGAHLRTAVAPVDVSESVLNILPDKDEDSLSYQIQQHSPKIVKRECFREKVIITSCNNLRHFRQKLCCVSCILFRWSCHRFVFFPALSWRTHLIRPEVCVHQFLQIS